MNDVNRTPPGVHEAAPSPRMLSREEIFAALPAVAAPSPNALEFRGMTHLQMAWERLLEWADSIQRRVLEANAPERTWRSPKVPPQAPIGAHGAGVQVLAVIADSDVRIGEEPFVDIVSYWPASGLWTVTFCSRACGDDAIDRPVRVMAWKPIDALPAKESPLWR